MKPKVLYTASTYSHIEHFHHPYLRELQRLGWEVHIACANAPAQAPYADKSFNIPFKKQMSSLDNLKASRQLKNIILTEGYELIVTHTSLAAFFTRLAVKGMRARPRLINVVHGYLFDDDTPFVKRQLLLNAERFTAPETDLVLTMNQYDYGIARKYRLGKEIDIIPGIGVDFAKLDADREKDTDISRENLGISEDTFVLIYPAEFSRRKSQTVLIRAMAQLPEEVVLILCGDGTELDRCRELAKNLKLDKRVLFPGRVENMAAWYSIADAAVSASRSEGLPFNVMEAMYCGLPVVASRVKGHTDLIDDGITGLLYDYGDVRECAEHIIRLKKNHAMNKQLSIQGMANIEEYSLYKVLPFIMKQYLSLANMREQQPIYIEVL